MDPANWGNFRVVTQFFGSITQHWPKMVSNHQFVQNMFTYVHISSTNSSHPHLSPRSPPGPELRHRQAAKAALELERDGLQELPELHHTQPSCHGCHGSGWKNLENLTFFRGKQRFMGNVGTLGTCFFPEILPCSFQHGDPWPAPGDGTFLSLSWRHSKLMACLTRKLQDLHHPRLFEAKAICWLMVQWLSRQGAHEETLQGPGHRDPDGYAAVICPKRAPPSQGPGSRWKSGFCPKGWSQKLKVFHASICWRVLRIYVHA